MSSNFLSNSRDSILSGIEKLAEEAAAIDIAVSYIQVSGWASVWNIVGERLSETLRVLFTDQLCVTHPNALGLALDAEVAIRRYTGAVVYHLKVYIARDEKGAVRRALIGSANLSGSALETSVEGAVFVDDVVVLRAVGEWFDELWTSAKNIDRKFVRQYRARWRPTARARIRMRRLRRRVAFNRRRPTAEIAHDDVDVLEDLCGTISLPITILSADQAGNNIRNLGRLLSVAHDFPHVSPKARSDLHLLGLVEGGELTAIGRRANRCRTTKALARAWCVWLKSQTRQELTAVNPKLANFKRCANLFWKLRPEIIAFFFDHLESRDDRAVLQAIELLCNGDEAVRELKLEDFKSLAPVLAAPETLPRPLQEAIESYHENKGSRSWRGDDRRILLEAYRLATQ